MKRTLFSILLVGTCLLGLAQANDKAKIVFISGKPSHGPMQHEHRAGNMILADALNRSGLDVEAVLVPHLGYPKDTSILDDAATVVIFCTGHQGHVLNPHLDEFDELMKSGKGVVMIHWATEAEKGKPGEKFLEWMGGFCDLDWSVNPHWAPKFKDFPDHPIANGVEPFSVHDEWYYHMRFAKNMEGVTPILSDLPRQKRCVDRTAHAVATRQFAQPLARAKSNMSPGLMIDQAAVAALVLLEPTITSAGKMRIFAKLC